MTSFAKQRGSSSSRILAFWAVAFCLALSAIQVSAAPDFIRSFVAGNIANGEAGVVANGPATSTAFTSRASIASPIRDEVFFFDESGAIAKVAGSEITIVSGTPGTTVPFTFNGATPVSPISSITYGLVYSLTFDSTGRLYVLEEGNSNVIRLDFERDEAVVVANIPNAYAVVPNKDGTFLYYSQVTGTTDISKIGLIPGSVVDTSITPGTVVGSGTFQNFIVSSDETKIYGSILRNQQFYELTLDASQNVRTFGVPGTVNPASPQVDVAGAVAVTGGFSAVAFYKSDTQLIIASDAGYLFFYDVAADRFSQIAGNGAAFDPATVVPFNGRALQNPTFPYFMSVSSTGRIYVDFQENSATPYGFFEALDLQTVSITLSPTAVSEGADATFTIARALTTDLALSVKLSRAGSTATPASDYTSSVSFTGNDVTVTIPANAASTTVVITTATDADVDPAEVVVLAIAVDAAYTISSTDGSKTLTINDVAAGPAPGTGTIEGDPHFVGFEGQTFNFQGHPGKIYNLLSDNDIQVNSLFGIQQNTPKTYSGGPILETTSIFTLTERVLIQSGGSNINTAFQVLYGINAIAENAPPVGNNLKVSYQRVTNTLASQFGFQGDDRVFAIVQVDYLSAYKFEIYIIENGRPAAGGSFEQAYAHRFLDLSCQIVETSRNPDGVLGQTHTPDIVVNKRNAEAPRRIPTEPVEPNPVFQIKGTVGDYEVKDGIFGKVFTYNKFDTLPANPPADPAPADPAPADPAEPNPAVASA